MQHRRRGERGSAAAKVIGVSVALTLLTSVAIVLAGMAGGAPGPAGGGTGFKVPEVPDPWSTAGAGAEGVPRRGGLDGSAEVGRLSASLTPLVSTSAQGPGTGAARPPVRMGLAFTLPEKVEEGAKAGYGEIGGPDRHVPVIGGVEAFPDAARLPLEHAKLTGWGSRFKR